MKIELKYLLEIVRRAGCEILKIYNSDDIMVDYKDDNSPLTQADRISHAVLKDGLEVFKIPFVSEEGEIPSYDIRNKWSQYWLVDPLDGTKEFVSRNGEFTINVALVEKGIPILGVIYVPVLDVCYFADENGSFRIDNLSENIHLGHVFEKSIRLPFSETHKVPVVVASRSHMNAETQKYIEQLEEKFGQVETVSRGSSLKLCMIAEGSADFYPRFGRTMEWDIASGHAIVRYAGKDVRDAFTGQPLQYNKENLSNPYFVAS